MRLRTRVTGPIEDQPECGEGASFSEPVPGLPMIGKRLPGVIARFVIPALRKPDLREDHQRVPLVDAVSDRTRGLECPKPKSGGRVVAVEPEVGGGQPDQCADLEIWAAGLASGRKGALVVLNGLPRAPQLADDAPHRVDRLHIRPWVSDLAGQRQCRLR